MATRTQLIPDITLLQFEAPLIGTEGDDYLEGSDLNDLMAGLDGNDIVLAYAGNNLVMGNAGNDFLFTEGDASSTLSGGDGDDSMLSGAGSDALNGGLGSDVMLGGAGNDRYVVDSGSDEVDEEDNTDAHDLVASYVNYTLPDSIENLTLLGNNKIRGIGNTHANWIIGNSKDNNLAGGPERDLGGADSNDADILEGKGGNDRYVVDSAFDDVREEANGGKADIVFSYVDYRLTANVENITLRGTGNIRGFGNEEANILNGNSGDNILDGQGGNDTIYGGSGGVDRMYGGQGNDLYVVYDQGSDDVQELDATSRDTVLSYSDIYILPANVEDLTLGANDAGRTLATGTGNGLNNLIQGNEISNELNGQGGDDTLIGAEGNDTLRGGFDSDTYVFSLGDGVDTVEDFGGDLDVVRFYDSIFDESIKQDRVAFFANGTNLQFGYIGSPDLIQVNQQIAPIDRFELANGLFMDANDIQQTFLIMSAFARAHNIPLTGLQDVKDSPELMRLINTNWRGGRDIPSPAPTTNIRFGRFENSEDLRGTQARDVLVGQGNVDELFGLGGNDLLISGAEGGILRGGTGNDELSGSDVGDDLFGDAGNDILDGGGGRDAMHGGTGDDVYVVDVGSTEDLPDLVEENPNEGTDTVESLATYRLPSWVENLTLIGIQQNDAYGNDLNNIITGNTGFMNYLNGEAGADTMRGGAGTDWYSVDNPGDVVEEVDNRDANNRFGADVVFSSVDFAIGPNIEYLNLQGNQDIDGVGNDLNNSLSGNTGNNSITGGIGQDSLYGGEGLDTLEGGLGDDYYIVISNESDDVRELNGEGTDTAEVIGNSYTLTDFVENLRLQESVSSFIPNLDSSGTGNALGNLMQGNGGMNTLSGLAGDDLLIGGKGNDTLHGGADNDIYQFRLGDGNDTVQDESGDRDKIRFTSSIAQNNIAFAFNAQNNLEIGYTGNNTDLITVEGQTPDSSQIELFEVQDGLYMTSEDVNNVWAMLQQYAIQTGLIPNDNPYALTLSMIEGNSEMMSIVNSGWHA
jgi:Ca2+-binding RTX toxin-like protein